MISLPDSPDFFDDDKAGKVRGHHGSSAAISGTFSAAAAVAMGFGGTSDAKTQLMREQLAEQKRQADLQRRLLAAHERTQQMVDAYLQFVTYA